MQAVILAAGKGTRLHPVSETRSKAMAPVAGKPIVARVLYTLHKNGIRDFIIIVSPTDQLIGSANLGLPALSHARYVYQDEQLGMAHALSLAAPHITGDFILSACDNLVPLDHVGALLQSHSINRAEATLSLLHVPHERISSTGIVEMRNEQVHRIVEKPALHEAPSNISSLPLYVFSPKILGYLPDLPRSPRGEYELQDAIQYLINESGPLDGIFTESRMQLTNVADLLALNRHYLALHHNTEARIASLLHPSAQIIPPVRIDTDVHIGTNVEIGPNVYVESNVVIGNNVQIRNALILSEASVADGETVDGVVLSPTG